jgi:hypothetical protein
MTRKPSAASPTAESITRMLTDDLAPGLAAMFAQIQAAEAAYSSTPSIRAGFDDREAEDGIASLRYYLEHAAAQVRRILAARR